MQVTKEYALDMREYFIQMVQGIAAEKINNSDSPLLNSKNSAVRFFGKYVNTFVGQVTIEMVDHLVNSMLKPTTEFMLFSRLSVKSVLYQSVNPQNQPGAMLSGLVIIPQGNAGNPSMPIMGYQHGTTFEKKAAPSCFDIKHPFDTFEVVFCLLFASINGYIITMADYQGLGSDQYIQPFTCARPLALSCMDLLLETHQFVEEEQDIYWNEQFYLMGYSQGGYVTMACAKLIQETQKDEKYAILQKHLIASAPGAGPYSLSQVMRCLMLREVHFPCGMYFLMTIRGFNATYGEQFDGIFTRNVAIKQEYWALWDLADGRNSFLVVQNGMPDVPREIFSDVFLAALEDQSSDVCGVLRANDVYQWLPEKPMRMFHSPRDGVVPYENAVVAETYFSQQQVDVPLLPMFIVPMQNIKALPMPVANRTHLEAAIPCLFSAYSWLTPKRFYVASTGMQPGYFMICGQHLSSPNQKYALMYQLDGNLSLYNQETGILQWSAEIVHERCPDNKSTKVCVSKQGAASRFNAYNVNFDQAYEVNNPGFCIFQHDGNLVVYSNFGVQKWASNTCCEGGRTVITDDGELRIEDQDGKIIWSRRINDGQSGSGQPGEVSEVVATETVVESVTMSSI